MEELQRQIADLQSQMVRHQHETIDGTTPLKKTSFLTYTLPDTQSQTATNYGLIFITTRPCSIKAVSEVHTVAGSSGSPVTLQIEKIVGVVAPGSGVVILATPFDLRATANTVQRGDLLSSNKTLTSLQQGDRVALKVSGTLTALKGVCITLEIAF